MHSSDDKTRAGRLLDQIHEDLSEEGSDSGLPEFRLSPKLLSQYAGVPTAVKRKSANAGHIMVLARACSELVAEVEKLKKLVGKS